VPADAPQAVEFLKGLAGSAPVLELGIGTGRLALPLAAQGVEVHGLDASEKMIGKLRAKPGGDSIRVTIGNFADMVVDGRFSLIYVVFNTFFGLLTQDDQVRCFQGVAQHLTDGGAFVIQAFVPDVPRFDRGQRVAALRVDPDEVELEATVVDLAAQRTQSQHVMITERGVRLYPVQLRWAWPSELDLMARIAGMRLRERFENWNRAQFASTSPSHISVYEIAP